MIARKSPKNFVCGKKKSMSPRNLSTSQLTYSATVIYYHYV